MGSRRHIALMGFMASGKSTIGKRLAARLKRPFCDTDAEVVRLHGPIARIFDLEGEQAFRAYERDAVERALRSSSPSIVALGGGAPTYAPTRRLLECHAYRVFLDVEPERIYERVRRSKTLRPMLGPAPTRAVVAALLRERAPLYREAELAIACKGLTQSAILDAIYEHLHAIGVAS
ncbi:MAG: shikimate kinase [Candidatus Tyrphobacter sp.]